MNSKKSRYSLNSKVFIVGAIIIVLLLNAILIALNDKISLEIDFTKGQIYDLTAESEKIVDQIDEPTDIIILTTGEESETLSLVNNLLNKYSQRNSLITVREVDVIKNPAEVQAYMDEFMEMSIGTLLIKQGERHEFVNSAEFFSQDGFSYIERLVTSKLAGFIDGITRSTVYFTTGHEERLTEETLNLIKTGGYDVTEIDLLTEELPDDNKAVVIISAPQTDFSLGEIEKLDAFFDRGGNVKLYFDPIYGGENLTNLETYLEDDWGIIRHNNVVLDQTVENSHYMLANVSEHDVTAPILESNKRIGYGPANSFSISPSKPTTVTAVNTLLTSSSSSYAKESVGVLQDGGTMQKSAGDEEGPFDIMMAATRQAADPNSNDIYTAYLTVCGSVMTYDSLAVDTRFANEDLLLNTLSWMNGGETSITIRGKELPGGQMLLSTTQFWTWLVVLIVVIPLALLAAGIVIYIKRRHR